MAKIYRAIRIKSNQLVLRTRPYDHRLANIAYLSDITVTNISRSFTYKTAAKINWKQNYVTVIL